MKSLQTDERTNGRMDDGQQEIRKEFKKKRTTVTTYASLLSDIIKFSLLVNVKGIYQIQW